MRFVVLLHDGRMRALNARVGTRVWCGSCVQCGGALWLRAPSRDGDAVCCACGRVVGHVIANAIVRNGCVKGVE